MKTLELCRKAEAILFGAAGVPGDEKIEFNKRPGASLLRLRKDLDLFANFRPVFMFKELIGASTLKPEIVEGLDLDHPARTDRRRLFRRAARHPHAAERGARGLQHHALLRVRGRAHRPRRLQDRHGAPPQGLLGREGQRAGDLAGVARRRHPGRQGVPGRRAHPRVRRRRLHDADAARPSSSTSWSPATSSATSCPIAPPC